MICARRRLLSREESGRQGRQAGGIVVTQPLDAVDPGDGERSAQAIVGGKVCRRLTATGREQPLGQLARGRSQPVGVAVRPAASGPAKAVFNMGGFRDERQDIHRADC